MKMYVSVIKRCWSLFAPMTSLPNLPIMTLTPSTLLPAVPSILQLLSPPEWKYMVLKNCEREEQGGNCRMYHAGDVSIPIDQYGIVL